MKKFFEKKAMDLKFRGSGQGHRLDEEKPKPRPLPNPVTERAAPSTSSQAAGAAALSRLEGGGREGREGGRRKRGVAEKGHAAGGRLSDAERDQAAGDVCTAQLLVTVTGSSMIVSLVCPICNRSIPYSDIHKHMSACLQEEYIKEPLTASVQMIHSLCRDASKRKACVDTLCRYLDNIIDHPSEEKYRKIRTGNKTFTEKVSSVSGADLFLEAVGFQQKLLPHQDSEEQFYVLPQTESSESESETGGGGGTGESEQLAVFRELLCSSEPLKPTLDRNVTLFTPSPRVNHFDLSDNFFQLSIDEIRKEQKLKTEAIERDQVLRTKAMRERDETRTAARYYRYTLLRVRLPDGLFLQAVFRPLDNLSDVRQVISHAFRDGTLTFSLSAFGQLLKNDSDTLAALGLVPSAVLNLSWVGAGPDSRQQYLDSELLQRIQQL